MNVLERKVASDCIWWVGEGINGVALQPKKLKKGTLLQTHFSGNQYSAFLRSFNRWGFRRVAFHDVPDGAVVYKNCLFRMDKPHLVKHMRMDSDVQDVFERHQLSGDSTSPNSSSLSDATASLPAAGTGEGHTVVPSAQLPTVPDGSNNVANLLQQLLTSLANSQGQQQPQAPPHKQVQQPPQPQISSSGDSTNSGLQSFQSFLDQSSSDQKPAARPPVQLAKAAGARSQNSSLSSSSTGQYPEAGQIVKAPKASDLRPPPGVVASSHGEHHRVERLESSSKKGGGEPSQPNGNILASALELLIRSMQQQQQEERKPPPEPHRNVLLRQLLQAAGEYMELAPSSALSGPSIRTALELLQVIGNQELGKDGAC